MHAISRWSPLALGLLSACATHAPAAAPPKPAAVVDAGPPDAGPTVVAVVDAGPPVVVPPPVFRNMPLVGAVAAQLPAVPTADTVTVPGNLKPAADRCDAMMAQKGPGSAQEGSDLVRGEWSRQLYQREGEAYPLGWREVSHGLEAGQSKVTLWRAGAPFQVATIAVKDGPLSVLPKVTLAPGFGDATYHFEDMAPPAMAGEDFPLCLAPPAGAKVEHSGQTWSQNCPPVAGQTGPNWQLPRVYGWSLVKGPGKDKVATYQKGDRFAEVTAAGTRWKVTLLDKAKLAAAQKAYPALDPAAQAHLVTGTGLIVGGKYLPGPYLLVLKDGQIKANDVVLFPRGSTPSAIPAEVLFDRMAAPGYWPTLRIVGDDGTMSNLASKDHDPDKMAAQLTKLLAAPGTDDDKVKRLAGFPGLHDVAEQTLRSMAQHWAVK